MTEKMMGDFTPLKKRKKIMKKMVLVVLLTTFFCGISAIAEEPCNAEKDLFMKSSADLDKTSIVREVTDRFTQLTAAINQKDIAAWETYYSKNEFVSAVAGGIFFATRSDWVQAITSNFSMRDSQQLKVREVKVFPLAPDTALLTSQNRVDMQLKSGQATISTHVYTMIWKKGNAGWQIIHSHESWVNEPAKQ
ncbi:MAG: nuclear transport factor 2 family protein [Desulfotignum sp.]|nr:nuclear transport factor 2 family protein [Desulfotignum sp.]